MSGYKMIKRTKGIDEFEFITIEDALLLIAENQEKRKQSRRKRWRKEAREARELKERQLEGKEGLKAPILGDKEMLYSFSQISFDSIPSNTLSKKSSYHSLLDSKDRLNVETNVIWEAQESELSPEITVKDTYYKPRLTNVIITISGWLTYGKDDYSLPFSTIVPNLFGDQYALIWESKTLYELGSALKMIAGEVTGFIVQQGLQATLLPVLMAGLSAPLWALKLTYFLDNPWSNGLEKAKRVGKVSLFLI